MEFIRHLHRGKRTVLWVVLATVGALLLLLAARVGTKNPVVDDRLPSVSSKRALEQELTELILQMEGVSRARVSVSLESGNEYVWENGKNTLILSGRVRGVAVVCDGGADPTVRQRIVTMLCALLDLPMRSVSVSQ
ncbi:MAG: hypothetical protein E7599_02015 [Ruminococcaceae bacterium]|nr:hypothetical protein [Oscillospiraceae bacterium]